MSILTREGFRAMRETAEEALRRSSNAVNVLVCAGTGCIAGGSLKVCETLKEECERRGLQVYVGLTEHSGEEKSLHNIGFRILDALAKASNITFQDRRYGFISELSVKGQRLFLLKPSTYMNLSGNAVRYWMNEKKIPIERLLIVNDDLALPVGSLRMKPGGSEGGHNGLRHITSVLGTNQYARLRFGVGNEYPKGGQVDFVLGRFSPEEEETIEPRIQLAGEMIVSFCLAGIQNTMNQFNNK